MQTKHPTDKQINIFVIGLAFILTLFSWRAFKAENGSLSILIMELTIALLIIYLIKREYVIKFYAIWMRVVAPIGTLITGILMVILFYLVFSPVGIILRLIRKDILHLKIEPNRKTYWIDRENKKSDKSSYERQF